MNRLHNLPALAFTFLALILLSACFGGGSQSCDAQFCGTSTPRTAAAPVTMPDNGNGGGPGTGGGGMTPDPMTPIAIPIPGIDFMAGAFDSTDTTSGGIGRIVDTQVDSKDAILLVIADANIDALLQAPLTTKLLDDTGIDLTYADMPSIQTDSTGTAVNARAGGTMRSGTVYEDPEVGNTGNTDSTTIYIDSHAPVILGYDTTSNNLQITMIGEPLSRMPTTTDAFSGTYSGLSAIARTGIDASNFHAHSTFNMQVTVANNMPTISNFSVSFTGTGGTSEGSVSASGITIDSNLGTFSGTATFNAGDPSGFPLIDTTNAGAGTLLGQFHGLDASGVTGAFHSANNAVLGGFAGSKE